MANLDLHGDEVTGGLRDAQEVMSGVQTDLKRIAQEGRPKILTGDSRREFFDGMSQEEFDDLNAIAFGLGPKGLNALERLIIESRTLGEEE